MMHKLALTTLPIESTTSLTGRLGSENINRALACGLAVVMIALLSSCATSNNAESLSQQIEALQEATDQARQASEAAEAMAARNQAELQAMRRDVDEARQLATEANARVDSAFKASQMK